MLLGIVLVGPAAFPNCSDPPDRTEKTTRQTMIESSAPSFTLDACIRLCRYDGHALTDAGVIEWKQLSLDASNEYKEFDAGDNGNYTSISATVTRCAAHPTRTHPVTGACVPPTCIESTNDAGADNATLLQCEFRVEYEWIEEPQSCGRRPMAWQLPRKDQAPQGVGSFLACSAALERAAVDAFAHMVNELVYHNAPPSLVALAERAMRDEVRHASVMGSLAEKYGGRVPHHAAPQLTNRTIFDMAIENAVEGCVRETYGALVAIHQGRAAKDACIRKAMAKIARDEISHAETSWALHHWLVNQLDDNERAKVQSAAISAIADLRDATGVPISRDLEEQAGVPSAARAAYFLDALQRAVWQQELQAAS